MGKKSTLIPASPQLREFTYTILFNLPREHKYKLKGNFYKLSTSNVIAKNFCDKATEEDVKQLLAQLGFEWFYVLFDGNKNPLYVKELFGELNGENRTARLKELVSKRLYISSSKTYASNLVLADQDIHDKEYRRIIEVARAGYHIRGWDRHLNGEITENDSDNADAMQYLARTLNSNYLTIRNFETNDFSTSILLYLYSYKNSYVNQHLIYKRYIGQFPKSKVTSHLRQLAIEGLITKHFRRSEYTITALGVFKTNKYLQETLAANKIA